MQAGLWRGMRACAAAAGFAVARRRHSMSTLAQIAVEGRYNSMSLQLPKAHWLSPTQPNAHAFKAELEQCIDQWTKSNKSAAWITVPPSLSWTVHPAVECGFEMHHVRDNHIFLMKWLEQSNPCRVPHYATHQVGVAGLVLDADLNVLVIRERNARVAGYKLPGGLADPGEYLADTAEREVFEETGVRSSFHSVLAMRQQHKMTYGVSDLYVVCRCTPETTDISICPTEIAEARWMPIDEYANQTSDMNARIARMVAREARRQGPSFSPSDVLQCDMTHTTLPSVVMRDRTFQLFLPAPANEGLVGKQ